MPDTTLKTTRPSPSESNNADWPRRRIRWNSPRSIFASVAVVAAIVLAVMTRSALGLSFAWSYLVAVNMVTFGLYGYDKAIAKLGLLRVPEFVLHVITTAGGTPAAFLGQNLFNHKTSKSRFRRMFWLIVVVQLVVFGAWIYFTREGSA